ncbi:hypothetical protein [Moraxella lacunata]|uniref:hypothetical protein n=1 Tax=Moraxella lacunata TaxID=477 RepID=UPI003EDEA201
MLMSPCGAVPIKPITPLRTSATAGVPCLISTVSTPCRNWVVIFVILFESQRVIAIIIHTNRCPI